MTKTATVTELRANLANYLEELEQEPLLILRRGQEAAYLVDPEVFDALLSRLDDLEDLIEGNIAFAQYLNGGEAVDGEEVFKEVGI